MSGSWFFFEISYCTCCEEHAVTRLGRVRDASAAVSPGGGVGVGGLKDNRVECGECGAGAVP